MDPPTPDRPDKIEEAARERRRDEDEAAWGERLRKLAEQTPTDAVKDERVRGAATVFQMLAAMLTAVMLVTNFRTVPLILLPLVGIAAAMWLLARRRNLAGLLASIASFAISAVFWLVQQSTSSVG